MNGIEFLTSVPNNLQPESTIGLPSASPDTIEAGKQFSAYLSIDHTPPIVGLDRIFSVPTNPKLAEHAMGDVLVAKLDAVGSEFKANMMRAHQEMDKAPDQLSLRDVLKLEYEFSVITLQIDVVGKGVQKAVQNIDTLVKMQ